MQLAQMLEMQTLLVDLVLEHLAQMEILQVMVQELQQFMAVVVALFLLGLDQIQGEHCMEEVVELVAL